MNQIISSVTMTNELLLVLSLTVIILGAVNSCSKKASCEEEEKDFNLNFPVVSNVSFLCAVQLLVVKVMGLQKCLLSQFCVSSVAK